MRPTVPLRMLKVAVGEAFGVYYGRLAFEGQVALNLGMEMELPRLRPPRHPKYDAIHRALLTGLLSNVGTKSDTYEYLGPRSVRFSIFPGSGLFSQKPKWVMAGELVETTKLYARTCAGVQPQWIEQAGEHLVERTYSEPRWDAKTASAIATEKVSLYGLVLIPARVVPYGPINGKLARELFIHHGLVLGEMRSDALFVRHNALLVTEVESLEAKIRQRNLLADISTRFAFYDARVPVDVTDGAHFETWRRQVERQKPRLLFMSKEDLLRADAPPITPENYPDRIVESFGPLQLPVAYRFEPGEANDGLTVTVPVAALTQLRPERYEWLVPGMVEEKIAALLRGLPGALRRNFVPVPEWAKAAATELLGRGEEFGEVSLREALVGYLNRQSATEISAGDFLEAELPEYLRMSFRVMDDAGKILATGRDLPAMQRKLAAHARGSFATIYDQRFNRDGVTAWDFGDLPELLKIQRFGMAITAFPAVVEMGEACGLRLLPSREMAASAHRAGVRRLFRMEYRRDVKGLANALPEYGRMALQYYLLGPTEELKQDLATLIVDRALFSEDAVPRMQGEYETLKHKAATRLTVTAERVGNLVGDVLQQYHQLSLLIDTQRARREGVGAFGAAISEVHDQLAFLLPRHFLLDTPFEWLEQFPRYLSGMRLRLEKLFAGGASVVERDREAMAAIAPWWTHFLQTRDRLASLHIEDADFVQFRWMVEEFRVSLFAQELGTALPISPRRLEKQAEKIRK